MSYKQIKTRKKLSVSVIPITGKNPKSAMEPVLAQCRPAISTLRGLKEKGHGSVDQVVSFNTKDFPSAIHLQNGSFKELEDEARGLYVQVHKKGRTIFVVLGTDEKALGAGLSRIAH